MALIPARYIGGHDILLDIGQLMAAGRPLVNGYGEPLKPTLNNAVGGLPAHGLRPGDTLMMPDYEVLGQTYLHFTPPLPEQPSVLVGVGKCILKEHAGQSLDALRALGYDYEMQSGRSDFIPLELENVAPEVSQEPPTPQFKAPMSDTPSPDATPPVAAPMAPESVVAHPTLPETVSVPVDVPAVPESSDNANTNSSTEVQQ